jgi:hypothetical protein
MKAILEELEEFQRRFNREIQTFINRMSDIDKDVQQNAELLKTGIPRNPNENMVTIKRLCELYPGIKSIKGWFYQNAWDIERSCVRRFGKRIYIDIMEFEKWLKEPKLREKKFAHQGYDETRPHLYDKRVLKLKDKY